MVNTIDMQHLRYLNLFNRITRVNTRFCFNYNDCIIFCVPGNLISRAIGENAGNIKQVSKILGKRIKVIAIPNGTKDMKIFIRAIVNPVNFKDLEIKNDEVILTSGSQNKAALIGRNKRRLFELQKVIKDFFGRNLRIA